VLYRNPNSAEVIRQNCADLNPTLPISGAQFTIDPTNSDVMTYNQQTLVAEVTQNKAIQVAFSVSEEVGMIGPATARTPAFPRGVQAGSLLVCAIHYFDDGGARVSSVADSFGNSMVRPAQPMVLNSPNDVQEIWYMENTKAMPAGQSMMITFDGTNTNDLDVSCTEYTGIRTAGSIDVIQQIAGSTAGASVLLPARDPGPQLVVSSIITCGSTAQPRNGLIPRSTLTQNLVGDKFLFADDSVSVDFASGCGTFVMTNLTFRAK